MHTVEQKLYAWHEIHKALDHARERLKTASSAGGAAQAATEAEVLKLQKQSDKAFAQVQASLANRGQDTTGAGGAGGGRAEYLL